MENSLPFFWYVDEDDESYLLWSQQAIELHSDDGTHKLALPVSRTTLKVCGGVPSVISVKSGDQRYQPSSKGITKHHENRTLGIHEVVEQDIVVAVAVQRSLLEQLLMDRRADSHVLLAQAADVRLNITRGLIQSAISTTLYLG